MRLATANRKRRRRVWRNAAPEQWISFRYSRTPMVEVSRGRNFICYASNWITQITVHPDGSDWWRRTPDPDAPDPLPVVLPAGGDGVQHATDGLATVVQPE
jgi:hypothetical protein